MLAFPAEPAALEANAVVTTVALQNSNASSAPSAAIAMVELKAALHKLFFASQQVVQSLQMFILPVNLSY